MHKRISQLLAAALLAGSTSFAAAQEFPTKPIRLVTPVTPGTVTDTMARLYANHLNSRLGWTIVIDNKPGGDFFPSTLSVLQAPADGYSIFHIPAGLTILPATRTDLPWDLKRDLLPLTRAVDIPLLFTATASLPANNLQEFIAYAKANPGKVSYGGVGTASPTTLAVEYLKLAYGLDIVLVPYKDGAVMTPDLVAGRIQAAVNLVGSFTALIKEGKLKPITLFGGQRSPALPQLATAAESTKNPDLEITSWTGYAVRTGTPKAITDRLERELLAVARLPEVRERKVQLGYDPLVEDSAGFAKRIDLDLGRFGKLIRDAKIQMK